MTLADKIIGRARPSPEEPAGPRCPLLVLTGFLGAGKTTVLNRVLGHEHHRKLGVIVNELGRIDIDGQILRRRSGAVAELAGGCVCHEVRTQEELWQALRELRARFALDLVILETTGIAEPDPIAAGLAALPDAERPADLVGVVTVVDAEAGVDTLARFGEARAQVQAASRIILTKLDLAPPAALTLLHARLAELNPSAEKAAFPARDEGTDALTTFLLSPEPPRLRAPHGTPHQHGPACEHAQFVAASFVEEAPLVAAPLLALLESMGDTLVRVKGFVNVAGDARRAFVEKAGARISLRWGPPWPEGPRRTELVLIGPALDPTALRRALWGVTAGTGEGRGG